ncbi:protein of unknown function [Xaviernesmea oryzae]|nr:protein of unknown function [Xaviernesmea oryzae]
MIAVVFLRDFGFSDQANLRNALRNNFPDCSADISSNKDKDPLFVFFHRGFVCSVMCFEANAPMAKTDPAFVNAWFWPTAWDELSRHSAHIVVSVAAGDGARARALTLQRILQSVLFASPSAIGVHYASSGTLLPAKLVSHILQEGDRPAPMLFLSCFFAREKDGSFPRPGIMASTKGLTEFGLLEIEARGFTGSPAELHPFLLTVGASLLEQKMTLKDGDTLSIGSSEAVRVALVRSILHDADVYGLYFQ